MSDLPMNELKVEQLTPMSKRIQIAFSVISKGETRDINAKKSGETHKLSDIVVADTTGSIILSLWDDDINLLEAGKSYVLKNGRINVFQNSMRLSKGKYGTLEAAAAEISGPNTQNNVSDKKVEAPPRRRPMRGRGNFRPRFDNRGGDDNDE